MNRIFWSLLALSLLTFSCLKDDNVDQAALDRELILQYLEDNSLTAQEDPSGLFYIIDQPGGAERPVLEDSVTVAYRGALLNGTVFDEREPGNPITFSLEDLILGWQIGIPKLGRGGSGQFFVPSALGYAGNRIGPIPPNSVLIFDIELIDF